VRYVDASAVLRVVFGEPGAAVPLTGNQRVVSSRLVEVEAFRAVDRARLTGLLDDSEVAIKRSELGNVLAMMDLVGIGDDVIGRARASFAVSLRALDAIHVATAEILLAEGGGEALEFWTHDERQAVAAVSRGLNVHGITLTQG
jgi:uncharacterized protein